MTPQILISGATTATVATAAAGAILTPQWVDEVDALAAVLLAAADEAAATPPSTAESVALSR